MTNNIYLGIELGSTRIKAVAVDDDFNTVKTGDYTWQSEYIDGIWTYSMDLVWEGLKEALQPFKKDNITAAGISGMMHGYLAFDKHWNLLAPFRTWQNTMTKQASEELSEAFNFHIPQRWSIAHLYQAILNKEEHVKDIAHITTLAGYVHFMLTGVNALGIGEASGVFPIDNKSMKYDEAMLDTFNTLAKSKGFDRDIRGVLPDVLMAGDSAGALTKQGSKLLDNQLKEGLLFAPCEGDAGTGMIATNAVAPRTGNVSAGTSLFAMVVLDEALKKVYPEIDVVMTPSGSPVAMVHCNNGTKDMNGWVNIIRQSVELFGCSVSTNELFTKLYQLSLQADADCGGLLTYNFLAGESVLGLEQGRPMVIRDAESTFTLPNFLRALLYSTMAALRIGMDILKKEAVVINSLTGHGGLFKTPVVGQRYMSAACGAPITVMETAGEGGPFGMALLAGYMINKQQMSLEDFLQDKIFSHSKSVTISAQQEDIDGFNTYMNKFIKGLDVQRKAIEDL